MGWRPANSGTQQGRNAKRFIETGIADVHRRLKERNFLVGLSRREFAESAGQIIGDINHAHPFRDGNGRTQLLYLKQLAENAEHRIAFARIDSDLWIEASKRSHLADYDGMVSAIFAALSD
jgi:cell filamentation protein